MRDLIERAVGSEVEIKVSISEGLVAAKADANQLELALLNLAVNARDAMPAGGTLSIATHEVMHEEGPDSEHPALPAGGFTDHAMPGMSGSELIRRVRGTYPLLPVLLASGYADMAEEEQVEDWPRLTKPYRQSELAAAIARAARRSESPAANVTAA